MRPALAAALLALCAGCAAPAERIVLSPQDTVKAAQQLLADRCLARRGLTPPRPGRPGPEGVEDALFGTGPAELSLTLPGGHVIQQHTDGCLAAAQRQLYGDQPAWFRASTTVGNLKTAAPATDRAVYERLRERALTRAKALLSQEIQEQKGTPP